jgi:GrpB-like predicted nucleotidyltransferase (UPF0157 family)
MEEVMPEIVLEHHRADWAMVFYFLKNQCTELFGNALISVDHFGSTSVPGIAAKPIIDMIGLATSLSELDREITPTLPAAFTCLGENGVAGRRYFVINNHGMPRGHLHLFEAGNSEYEDRILFRDFLQRDPIAAKDYENLKKQLARDHPNDPMSYWLGKQEFVKKIVMQAKPTVIRSKQH